MVRNLSSWIWCLCMAHFLLSFLFRSLLSWDASMLLIYVCKGVGGVLVYGCCNLGTSAVCVMILSFCFYFLLLVSSTLSTLPCCACWLMYKNLFKICVRVSGLRVWMARISKFWVRGCFSHSIVTTLLLLFLYIEVYHIVCWGGRSGVRMLVWMEHIKR